MSTPTEADFVAVFSPRYCRANIGQLADDPLRVAGTAPVVDIKALARLFTGPTLVGECTPGAFWRGVQLVWLRPSPCTARGGVAEVFAETVARLCDGAGTVGVRFSGGLDSLAVLTAVAGLRPARRVLAYCVKLTDDQGISSIDVAQGLVRRVRERTGVAIELVEVDPADCSGPPRWSPHGPRLDALPAVNTVVAERAAQAGCELLLHGDGADELLGAPSYAATQVLGTHGIAGAWRYVRDFCGSGAGIVSEALAMFADLLPSDVRSRWYWAANWPELTTPTVSSVLAAPLREQAAVFANEWIAARLDEHVRARRRWAQADAMDAFWPRAYLPPSGSIREVSPFLTEPVVAAGLAASAAERYAPRLPSAYQRYKAVVAGLLPDWIRPALPRRKQYFTRALANLAGGELATPHAVAAGLFAPDALHACTDTATRMTAAAVETWLAGAHASGYSIPDSGTVAM